MTSDQILAAAGAASAMRLIYVLDFDMPLALAEALRLLDTIVHEASGESAKTTALPPAEPAS